jgi:hypothetical protein
MIDNESTPQFIYAFDAGGVLGTAVPDQVLFAEQVTAFKTTTGKIVRQYWMEGASPVDQIFYPPFTGLTPLIAAADYFTGDDDIVVSNVDGSYPLTTLRSRTKTNDALRANAGLTQ